MAEKKGFDHLWIPDHVVGRQEEYPDAWTVLSAIGVLTKHIRLGTCVTDPYRRSIQTLAQTVSTLDQITGGRTVLGLGSGEAMNLVPFGMPCDHSLTRLKEAVHALDVLWRADESRPAVLNGRYYSLRNAFLQVRALQKPRPPIYLGASLTNSLRFVGEAGDGWLSTISTPSAFRECCGVLREGAKLAGRVLDQVDRCCQVYVAISGDREEAYRAVAPQVKRLFATSKAALRRSGYGHLLVEGFDSQRLLRDEAYSKAIQSLVEAMPRELVERSAAYGRADHVIEKVEEYLDAGATHIIIAIPAHDKKETMDILSEEVLPYFRSRPPSGGGS